MKKNPRVFVVDDDNSARHGLTRLLHTGGHDVSAYSSIDEFLDALGPEVAGCVVLDTEMVEPPGAGLVAAIDKSGAELAIIAVTAIDGPASRRIATAIKAVGLFRKPVDGTALRDAVQWAIRTHDVGANH